MYCTVGGQWAFPGQWTPLDHWTLLGQCKSEHNEIVDQASMHKSKAATRGISG